MDNESGQVNSDCLDIPLILREIFRCFTSTELLQLSLVNKRWNYEARSFLRTRGDLTASINKNHTCQDLRAFASDLRRMKETGNIVPFLGMTITIGGAKCINRDYCEQSACRELECVYEEILGGLTWKHLSVRHLVGWEEHKSCPGFILQKTILRKFCSALEELSVQLEWSEAESFQAEFLNDCYFPRLKTFRFLNEDEYDGTSEPKWSDFIKTVVSTAPNLQILYTKDRVDLGANLLEGSSAVHVADYPYSPSKNEIPESVASEIKLHGMNLLGFSPDFSLGRFHRITSTLLQSSRILMRSMKIDGIFLAPLTSYGVCLENVRTFHLALELCYLGLAPEHVWRIADSFDFTRMFPNLDTVTIFARVHRSPPPAEFNEMTEQVRATLRMPEPGRAAKIKHLKLEYFPSSGVLNHHYTFVILDEMFPHVQRLSIKTTNSIPFTDIGHIKADLKQLDVILKPSNFPLTNLDSIFCGIFPEEVAQLQAEDEDFLRLVNIVPVRPSLTHLKELSAFQVYYEKRLDEYWGPTDNPTLLFSKVTGLIAFERCPNLIVTLTSEDERLAEALGHLRPYAAVIFKPTDD